MNRFYIVKTDDKGNEAVWSILSNGVMGWTNDPSKMLCLRQEAAQELLSELPMVSLPQARLRSVSPVGMGLGTLTVITKTGKMVTRILE